MMRIKSFFVPTIEIGLNKKSTIITGTVLLLCLMTGFGFGQEFDKAQIKTIKVSDSVYMLEGVGGNIGVCFGEDGTLLIDDQFGELKQKIEAAISKITPHPVRFILNTNWHYDHARGNQAWAKSGALIIAHENTRVRMMSAQEHPDLNMKIPPYPQAALPVITIKDVLTLHLNVEEIHVFHIAKAHSDADLAFYFRKANVLHTGDLFFVGGYPYIDIHNGGSINGMIRAVKQLMTVINRNTKVIPGHGPLSNLEGLKKYHNMLTTVRDRVQKLINQGNSLEEIGKSNVTQGFEKDWQKMMPRQLFINIIYKSLTDQKTKHINTPGP